MNRLKENLKQAEQTQVKQMHELCADHHDQFQMEDPTWSFSSMF
jgi:hypothetical protein